MFTALKRCSAEGLQFQFTLEQKGAGLAAAA